RKANYHLIDISLLQEPGELLVTADNRHLHLGLLEVLQPGVCGSVIGFELLPESEGPPAPGGGTGLGFGQRPVAGQAADENDSVFRMSHHPPGDFGRQISGADNERIAEVIAAAAHRPEKLPDKRARQDGKRGRYDKEYCE